MINDISVEVAAFYKDLDQLIAKHKDLGFITIIGALEFGKHALILEGTKDSFFKKELSIEDVGGSE